MYRLITTFFREVCEDYARRFARFFAIVYPLTALAELARFSVRANLHSLAYRNLSAPVFVNALWGELVSRPHLFALIFGAVLLNFLAFAALFFAFSGSPFEAALGKGFKNLPRYLWFVIMASVITALGFGIPATVLVFLAGIFGVATKAVIVGALTLAALAGLGIAAALSNGPFILLLEGFGPLAALRESAARMRGAFGRVATLLALNAAFSGGLLWVLAWVTFAVKLKLVGDLLPVAESMLGVFAYSIPWVIAATFFDLSVYHLYLRLRFGPQHTAPPPGAEALGRVIYPEKLRPEGPMIPPTMMRILAVFTVIAFGLAVVGLPVEAHAGGIFTVLQSVLGVILLAATCTTAVGCAIAPALAVYVIQQGTVGFVTNQIGGAVCSGSYDAWTGSCSYSRGTQQIQTGQNVKFKNVAFGQRPSSDEYSANPNLTTSAAITWKADAPTGVHEWVVLKDLQTGREYPAAGGVSCSDRETTDMFSSLAFGRRYQAEIRYDSCIQIKGGKRTRSFSFFCSESGQYCGCYDYRGIADTCGTMVTTTFVTPTLPNVFVDLKVDGGDGPIKAPPGTPVTLSWTSQYGTACSAEGDWNGPKTTTGSERVVPVKGSERYVLVCTRPDGSTGSDSVGYNITPLKSIQITTPSVQNINFESGGLGGPGGPGGGLRIETFNVTSPLNPGDKVTVTWQVRGATRCEADNGIGRVPTSGTAIIRFFKTVTLTLTCSDDAGHTASAQRTITVRENPTIKEVKPE